MMIVNKKREIKKYIIKYSMAKVIFIAFAQIFIFFIVLFSIYLLSSVFFSVNFFHETYGFFIYLYSFVAILMILVSFINYYGQRTQSRSYQIKINDSWISVDYNLKKKTFKFRFKDIERYTVINCGMTYYEAIKIEIKGSKKILIYSSMENYGKFEKRLKKSNILGIDYIYKALWYSEANIY
jgi:hypothetical protein